MRAGTRELRGIRMAVPAFRLKVFPEYSARGDAVRTSLRPNSARPRASARANGVRISRAASAIARGRPRRNGGVVRHAEGFACRRNAAGRMSRCARGGIRSRGRVAGASAGAGYSPIAVLRRFGASARRARRRAFQPPPWPSPLPALARVARYRPTFASGRTAHSTAAGQNPADGAGRQPNAARIGARGRHGGEHACQKNIGSWSWTTIRKCAPG